MTWDCFKESSAAGYPNCLGPLALRPPVTRSLPFRTLSTYKYSTDLAKFKVKVVKKC